MSTVNYITKFFSLLRRCREVQLTILLLTLGICAHEAPALINELRTLAESQLVVRAEAFGVDDATTLRGKLPEIDGVYLYGQSPKPGQIGQEYMVFEVRRGKVFGGLYLPYSEFSCFYGTLESGKLALMVAHGPESDAQSALAHSQQVAAVSDNFRGGAYLSAYPHTVALRNYYQLASLSASDQQILKNCRNNYHE